MREQSSQLILLRHGQSVWNAKNLFTGWVDVPLSPKGVEEAIAAGEQIKAIPIDVVFTSTLIRASMTACLAMSRHSSSKVIVRQSQLTGEYEGWSQDHSSKVEEHSTPMIENPALNERMYGKLQGSDKDEMRQKYGKEQVHIWRRSFDTPPPQGESLKMCAERTLPYFNGEIKKALAEGKNVLIAAHGNSLRSIVMAIENLSEEEVLGLEIPTGKPLFYEYNEGQLSKKKG